jgi:hypothetical protein
VSYPRLISVIFVNPVELIWQMFGKLPTSNLRYLSNNYAETGALTRERRLASDVKPLMKEAICKKRTLCCGILTPLAATHAAQP